MAKRRMIDTAIWTNRKYIRLTDKQKLLFLGLITIADDEGRLWNDGLTIKAKVFPVDAITIEDIQIDLEIIKNSGLIEKNDQVIQLNDWKDHQKIQKDRYTPSRIPPLDPKCIQNVSKTDTKCIQSGDAGKGSIGKGRRVIYPPYNPSLGDGFPGLLNKIKKIIEETPECENALKYQNAVYDKLIEYFGDKFDVVKEYRVTDRGDGKTGRVDIAVITENGMIVPIELDREKPRKKSIEKILRNFKIGIIGVRGGKARIYSRENEENETGVIKLFKIFIGKDNLSMQAPTPEERKLLYNALEYNPDLNFWKPYCDNRLIAKEQGSWVPSMKAFFATYFREYEKPPSPSSKQNTNKINPNDFKTGAGGRYVAYCSKCGQQQFPDKYEIYKGSVCCDVDYSPVRPKELPRKRKSKQIPRAKKTQSLSEILENEE